MYKVLSKDLDDKNPKSTTDEVKTTALHEAAVNKDYKICEFITKNSKNLEKKNRFGETAIRVAQDRSDNEKIIKLIETAVEEERKSKKRKLN